MKKDRRKFIKNCSFLSGLSLLPLKTSLFANTNNISKLPKKWDEVWDIIVVGSGFAGSSALCQSLDLGAKSLMIDKMPVLGGNSAINGGAFSIVGSPQQKERKIEDSYDLYLQDLLKAGRGLNDERLVRIIAENGLDAYKFTLDKGVIYRNNLGHFGGHSVPRTIWPEINSGAKITLPMQEFAKKQGGVIRTKVILDDLIFDERSKNVIGIKVRENYKFNFDPLKNEEENSSGVVKYYKINGGVIIATGGYSYDVNFRQKLDSKLTPDLDCTNHYGATAYALKVMMKNKIKTRDLTWIQLGPWGSPDEKGFGIAPVFAIPAFAYGVMVDVRTGKRFVNELADRKERSDAIIKIHKNSDGTLTHPVVFCDSLGATGTRKENVYRGIRKKVINKFNTLKELADFYKIPYENLKETVNNYNNSVKEGKDKEMGKPLFKLRGKKIPDISKPPFYAFRALPKVHHTMGGIVIDPQARVLNENNEIIGGLYAAGEAVGGPHGASRLGSCAVPDCLVFGRVAAKSASKRLKIHQYKLTIEKLKNFKDEI